jgi:hypothetical protein
MAVYSGFEDIRTLSNASLTSIIDVTNLNFKGISESNLEFLNNVSYNETLNEMTLNRGTFTYSDITDKLSLLSSGVATFTLDSSGKAVGNELLVDVSESKRQRFTDFEDYPAVGVPGEVVYTGIAGTDPTFGEDFIGYLDDRGWVSLTSFSGHSIGSSLILTITPGTPPTAPVAGTGTGVLWLGAPGYETHYEPQDVVTYFTDASGKTFDILSNHIWEKIGNDAKLKLTGKVIIGDSTNNGSIQYVDGNQQTGYVLTADVSGNASWQPLPPGSGAGPTNPSYLQIVDFVANTSVTINHSLNSTDLMVRFIDLGTNAEVEGHVDNYTLNTVDATLSQTNSNVKVVIFSAGGQQTIFQILCPDDKFLTALATSLDGDLASNSSISNTPVDGCYVAVFVNGVEYEVGDGVTTKSCYFASTGASHVPKGFSSSHANGQVQAGDFLYWNKSVAGFNLTAGSRISLMYVLTN